MKKALTPNVLFLTMFLAMIVIMSLLSCEPKEDKYAYKVYYRTFENHTDYTNSIEYLPNGGIRYTDEYGRKVERFGTFSIEKIK